jgi:ribonuclease P protein component
MATAQAKSPQPPPSRLATLKRRADFLRIRNGARHATRAFVLEAKRRGESDKPSPATQARFGFTVSKQVGGAVERNRIRRRLKAAVCDVVHEHTNHDFDYVLIARRAALDTAFAVLVSDLVNALDRVNAMPRQGHGQAARR